MPQLISPSLTHYRFLQLHSEVGELFMDCTTRRGHSSLLQNTAGAVAEIKTWKLSTEEYPHSALTTKAMSSNHQQIMSCYSFWSSGSDVPHSSWRVNTCSWFGEPPTQDQALLLPLCCKPCLLWRFHSYQRGTGEVQWTVTLQEGGDEKTIPFFCLPHHLSHVRGC